MTSYKTPEVSGLKSGDWPAPLLGRGHGPGRLLRALIGVQEDVLAWVPEERPKLTRTGAIVLCAPVMAAASLWIALNQFLQVSMAPAIVTAVLWGGLICVLDSWLIASTHGVIGRGRVAMLLPRLLVALVIGALISEPMTMKIFETAIGEQIKTTYQATEDRLRAAYGNCYPTPVAGADCTAYKLTVSPPDGGPLRRATEERDALEASVRPLIDEETRLRGLRAEECTGGKVQGTSGIDGEGPRCRIRAETLDRFSRDNNMDDNRRRLDDLRDKVVTETTRHNEARAAYAEQVPRLIEERIAAERDKHATVPGLLERFEALNQLSARSWTVWWAHLLVAGLLILIDCFPVLTKLISRPGAYDRRLAALVESKERLHDNDVRLNERLRMGDYEMRLHQEEARIGQEREQSDADARLRGAEREAELRARMDEVIAQVKRARARRDQGP
ncbi:DUF4407 domain-containing protein [Nonomuraea sp. K274]|uniref:DUF4407 domain-containing protein n=1 Tax=Nonomuraea cypriaca TaxID=1187855 RepID=A0A931A967_9ACTN|nr:DUF4407 domain-containing protein [Nonomuraea cypriaca]MBF8188621.1 DUF4407 domain-containing protein [Nonomuraea cypriaca]